MPSLDADLKVCRIASLTLINAMIFQQVLADRDHRVSSLSSVIEAENVAEKLMETWRFIQDEIDYVPIFTVSTDTLREVIGIPDTDAALKKLARAALRITGRRAALRHDLMGRIFHRLLADAKYFGAFYTTVPAASLLLKLTLDSASFEIDWADIEQISKLRIADLACGTGTLLKASLQTIVDNHIRARAELGKLPDLTMLHRVLVEKVLWGLDVVPFAIHLAGSALALHEPDVEFGEMNLITLPIGGPKNKLGSLELLAGSSVAIQADLFGPATAPSRMTGHGDVGDKLRIPQLSLCVMNPPFTRSVGGNLLFGHAPKKERTRMQTALKKLVANTGSMASITAGLGSVFVAAGHRLMRGNGHMSLVLPRALLSGVAWKDTRILLGNSYHVRYIIVSHEPGSWNFSENTELSECLIVADWVGPDAVTEHTRVINLWNKPKSSVEALAVAGLIRASGGTSLDAAVGSVELKSSTIKYGEVIDVPPEQMRMGDWNKGAVFAQTELCRAAHQLSGGKVFVPGAGVVGKVPLTPIKDLGDVGPDRRDIWDGFDATDRVTEYPALWGHDTGAVICLGQRPNRYLRALAAARPGRTLRDAHLLWSRSGRLLVAERLWLTTTRLVALRMSEAVLSNTWWPIAIDVPGVSKVAAEKSLVLWLNSSLGLLSIMAARVDTRGAWIDLKKPTLQQLMVLDPRRLKESALTLLCETYDSLKNTEILPMPHIAIDTVRAEIDTAIAKALGVKDDFSRIRKLLAAEPIIAVPVPPPTSNEEEEDEEESAEEAGA